MAQCKRVDLSASHTYDYIVYERTEEAAEPEQLELQLSLNGGGDILCCAPAVRTAVERKHVKHHHHAYEHASRVRREDGRFLTLADRTIGQGR